MREMLAAGFTFPHLWPKNGRLSAEGELGLVSVFLGESLEGELSACCFTATPEEVICKDQRCSKHWERLAHCMLLSLYIKTVPKTHNNR